MCQVPSFEIKISNGLCVSRKCDRTYSPVSRDSLYSVLGPPRITPIRSDLGNESIFILYTKNISRFKKLGITNDGNPATEAPAMKLVSERRTLRVRSSVSVPRTAGQEIVDPSVEPMLDVRRHL